MEGLIPFPFIYKAIKQRRNRSHSRCSSTGSARGFGGGVCDVAWEQKQWVRADDRTVRKADGGKFRVEREMTHRRHRSLEELAGEVGASPEWRAGGLTRGRSARIFTCISGM